MANLRSHDDMLTVLIRAIDNFPAAAQAWVNNVGKETGCDCTVFFGGRKPNKQGDLFIYRCVTMWGCEWGYMRH